MKRKHFLFFAIAILLTSSAAAYYLTYVYPQQILEGNAQLGKPGMPGSANSQPQMPQPIKVSEVSTNVKTIPAGLRRNFTISKTPKPLPNYLAKSIDWLVEAQLENGGWGAGTHDRQDILDPHAVQTDPATTAVAGMALIRVGNTLETGPQHKNLHKALLYLLAVVRETPEKAQNITAQRGTQIQAKLGENIDVALTSQFFSRVLPMTQKQSDSEKQVLAALEKCIRIIQNSQQSDGSWSASGWAPVLNSAMACNALEMADLNGLAIDTACIKRAQAYQRGNVTAGGNARTDRSAGVALYSLSSSQRTNAKLSKRAESVLGAPVGSQKDKSVAELRKDMEDKGVSADEAQTISEAVVTYNAVSKQMDREDVLSGFGNNGGEEFLSYMMTSESYVHAGDEKWEKWYAKMSGLFGKIQNSNGSWSGHHCITSPVFCTASVILTLTPDRDPLLLASKD